MNLLLAQFLGLFRRRPFVAGALALTAVLAVGNYFLWQTRDKALAEHTDARHKGELMLRALDQRPQIEADLAALRTATGYLEKNLLDEQSMEVNLGYFYKLEKPARVRLVRLNQLAPPPASDKKTFKAVPFSMQVTAPYRNLMSFLRALETGSRIVRIRSCSFERSASDNGEYLMELTVDALAKL